MTTSLDAMARAKLAELDAASLKRTLVASDRTDGVHIEREGPTLISFCCNDYLNLTHDPRVKAAAHAATERYGVGSGASRLVTGNHPLLPELEARLARLKGAEDAVVFGSGYLANLGIIPTLVGPKDLILADELSHACLLAGRQLSGAASHLFRHNDAGHLEDVLETHRGSHRRCLILTDGVFSMDGDLAPLPDLVELAERFDAWLMTDDAHGIGVIGGGRGSTFAFGEKLPVPLQMGTLSKAVGGYGGYICASRPVIDLLKTRARTLIYSTGLPPGTVAAAIAALDIIESEPAYCARPVENAALFCRTLNLPAAESPIVPLVLGEAETALAASRMLEAEGFLVTAIRPPTVPQGTARLRFTFTAKHTEDDILRLAHLLRDRGLAAA
ncbi:MAG: 8-amino-7-oxononanoate synthase [Rhodospirillaceae bacterium]|nr:8-amino-7-oxononanoate synthase [Rhodospirillaceae bacterium]